MIFKNLHNKVSDKLFLLIPALAFIFLWSQCSKNISDEKHFTVASYYFPNYHVDPRNEEIHGKGWSEWELVKAARPRFPGHRQPKVPLWGYTDESEPKVMAKKIDAAADNGIDAFIFDWYYYNGKPFLQAALENGFIHAKNRERLKFALMWANHDWLNIHPRHLDKKPQLLFSGIVSPKVFDKMTDYIIEKYFKNPAYWQIRGKPYFSIYELQTLVKSFGGLDATRKALDSFRQKTRAAGFSGLHLDAVIWGNPILPGESKVKNAAELVDYLGFDSVTSYVWIHHVRLPDFPQTPYTFVQKKYLEYAREAEKDFHVPYFPNVSMGWDSSPRCAQDDPFVNKGYPFMPTISGNTPEAFKNALLEVKNFLQNRPDDEKIVTINCWNEWTEGSYLEPDTVNGMKYLEAVRDVFAR
ncbi:MAG: hypothetical protein GWP06_09135 [Actinobacteria bacterium]|nr:hypothetical protein [Actinomycetota bacterium]